MLQPGKMAEVAEEIIRFNIDAVALQEIRWSGQGRMDKKQYTLLYSGAAKTGQKGTGFILTKKARQSLLLFEPINERICKIRLKGRFRNITLISAYAPTEESEEEEKITFYQQLERVIQTGPRYDVKIIMGDLNAQVGKEDFTRTVAGQHSLHSVTNDNGTHLCQFAESNNMTIKSTCFPHKDIHKGTWKAPNGTVTQIDHVLISTRHTSTVSDVRTARGPNCESDHFLVKIKLKERLATVRQGTPHKKNSWNLDKLKDPDLLQEFKEMSDRKMTNELRNAGDEIDMEMKWDKISKVLKETADEVLGERPRRRGEEWFDEECREVLKIRNEKRIIMLQRTTRQSTSDYQSARRRVKKMLRDKKKRFLKAKVEQIEELRGSNESRKFYGAVKYINRGFQPKTEACKDKSGKIVEGKEKTMDRWAEYFGDIFRSGNQETVSVPDTSVVATGDETDIEPPDMEDFEEAVEKLKNNKVPGKDSLVAEFFKNCGELVKSEVYALLLDVWEKENMPKSWTNSLICPVFKKGDKLQCSNYRGISLLAVAYKIFSNILLKKLNLFAEKILLDYQCGFRRGKGTTDQVFVMRQILEKCWEYKIDLHLLFVDFRQAFDSVDRVKIIEALKEFRVPQKLIRLISMTLRNSEGQVCVGGNVSPEFPITAGVRQGDALSAALFNLALHKVVADLNITGNILHSSTQLCAYADDICLVARNIASLKETFSTLNSKSKEMGLTINEEKTKYMVMSAGHSNSSSLDADGYSFKKVKRFTYLGSELSEENKLAEEVNKRIMAANRAYFANLTLFRSSLLSKVTKTRLYKTLIRPVLTYGAETWTLTATMTSNLMVFERKLLRKIYGPVFDGGAWRLRRNAELYSLYKDASVVQFIKSRRIEWLGHVIRMPENRMPIKLLNGTVFGTRRRGRPRRRWLQDVEEDLKVLGVAGWRSRAMERDDWRNIVREAKAHLGL